MSAPINRSLSMTTDPKMLCLEIIAANDEMEVGVGVGNWSNALRLTLPCPQKGSSFVETNWVGKSLNHQESSGRGSALIKINRPSHIKR